MKLYDIHEEDMWGRKYADHDRIDPIPFADPHEDCDKCHLPAHRRRTGPFTIVWTPGSDVIPDFIFGYQCEFAVTERVKKAFETAGLRGYVSWPLKMVAPPKRTNRKLPIVPWPYAGPPFWDIHVTEIVELNRAVSTVEYRPPCPECGREIGEPIEEQEDWLIVVDRDVWNGADFMNVRGVCMMLLTERAADLILESGFTNVKIRRVGEIR